ncbi:helix-turn-helix transcriptional regulator [Achromobacter sp. Root565]|uniref:helix-turn-helix domain-containing protein n=1 Tax=Achromobacter sp. Root565 TaxID=1736564 RepID=UPI0009E6E047|nr:helix-turn-helix transcriptional regulator [Achromobacter sp. Root565]
MNTLADRLSTALAKANVSQADLARACGIAAASVHGWLTGRTKALKGSSLIKAAAYLNVREIWLAEGKGPMERDEDASPIPLPNSWPFWGISPERYEALPPYQKGLIEGRVQAMIEEWEASTKSQKE